MMISTKGRYALRVLVDLAEHDVGSYIPLKEVAQRQDISEKYLESIIKALVRSGDLEGVRGKGGGYRLTRSPDQYSVGEILRVMEGGLAPVACLEEDSNPCARAAECRTIGMWTELYQLVTNFFDSKTLADLMACNQDGNDYVI
jgi:Rrf2 family protein